MPPDAEAPPNLPAEDAELGLLRTFPILVADLEGGQTSDDLTEKVRDIVAALNDAAAAGGIPAATLTLALKFRLVDGTIEVMPDIKAVLPKTRRGRTILFATPSNSLCRNNPRQRRLPLQDASVGSRRVIHTA